MLAPLLVAALILACVAALVATQRTRRSGLVVDQVRVSPAFSPDGDGKVETAAISFRVKGPDHIHLDVMSSGRQVRRLGDDVALGDRTVAIAVWDGRTDSGKPAPPGKYRIRIKLLDRGRTIGPGERMILVRSRSGGAGT